MDDILRHVDQTDIDIFKELADMYSRHARDVQKDIFDFYGRYAEENEITLAEAKKQLRGEDLSDYQANARRYFEEAQDNPELWERLNEQYRAGRVTRLEALHLDLEYQAGVLNGDLQGLFRDYLSVTAGYAYQKVMGGLSSSTLNQPAIEQIINMPWNGYNYSEDLWGNTDNLVRDLKKTLTKGFVRGSHPRVMANELRGRYEVAQHRAETLVRTDGTNVITNATAKRYIDAGLEYYTDHVHMDDRTTEKCKEIHRKAEIKPLSELISGVNAPPYHYSCRTTIVPIEEELNVDLE
jgi:SPP1 gp7 family putative phage head morphogenesis protein